MYYQSKRNFFKNWLGDTNLKPYIGIIFVVFCVIAAILFIGKNNFADYFSMIQSNEAPENGGANNPVILEENTTPEETAQTEPPEKIYGYRILVNKADNIISIWKTEDGKNTQVEKVMLSSVNTSLEEGEYEISEKNVWRKMPDAATYTQYSSKSPAGILFHSPIYEFQLRGYMNVYTYQLIGRPNDTVDGITLTVADAKWIFENCIEGTPVEVYNDSDMQYPLEPEQLMTIPEGVRWDPTDPDRSNMWVQGRIAFLNGVTDKTITVGSSINAWDGIFAKTEDGRNVTNNVIVRNHVNNQEPGVYSIEYIMVDSTGQVIRKYSTVTVEPMKSVESIESVEPIQTEE